MLRAFRSSAIFGSSGNKNNAHQPPKARLPLDSRGLAGISFNHMVERNLSQLNAIFGSLSDGTRRDILKRISKKRMSVSEIARHYSLSLAAVAKHLSVLERAGLIFKTRRGKELIVMLAPKTLGTANSYLENYRELWENRLDSLDKYIKSIKKKG